jgi:hypothetical protein
MSMIRRAKGSITGYSRFDGEGSTRVVLSDTEASFADEQAEVVAVKETPEAETTVTTEKE